MRFACENCQTRYTLADEKVRGKVLKIRCKKCSEVIVVRDPALDAAAAARTAAGGAFAQQPARVPGETTAGPAGGGAWEQQATRSIPMAEAMQLARAATSNASPDPIWYALRRGEQLGPMPREELAARVAAAELGPRTYVWREGMEDWQRLERVSELADLLGAPAPAEPPAPPVEPPAPEAAVPPQEKTPVEAPSVAAASPPDEEEAVDAPVAGLEDPGVDFTPAASGLDPAELFGTSLSLDDTPELPQQPHPAAEMPAALAGTPPVVDAGAAAARTGGSRLPRLVAIAVVLAAILAAGAYYLMPTGSAAAAEGTPHPAALPRAGSR